MNRGNEPAHPSHGSMGEVAHEGMTIREAFSMAAMQGLLAYPGSVLSGSYHTNATADDAAKAAVMYAEALIEALKETP